MDGSWIEGQREGRDVRHALGRGLTRWGGPGAQIAHPASGRDQVQLWDHPPRLVFVGQGEAPRVDGRAVEELELHDGALIEWRGERWVFRSPAPAASLEEISSAAPQRTPAPLSSNAHSAEERAWQRVRAALWIELDLVDGELARRARSGLQQGTSDPDRVAQECAAVLLRDQDAERVLARAAKLQRELILAGQRSEPPAAKKSEPRRSWSQFFAVAAFQILAVAFLVFSIAAAVVVVRYRWGVSFDTWIDGLVGPPVG